MVKKLLVIIPAVILAIAAGLYFYANQRVKSLVDTRIEKFLESGDYRELDYESVWLELDGDIRLRNLHVVDIAGNEYILEKVHLSDFDYFNEVPHHLHLTATGLKFPAGIPEFGKSPNRALNNYLEAVMDEDYLPLEITYQYQYQSEDDLRLDSAFSVDLPDSFHLNTDSVMRNVSLEQLNENTFGPSLGSPQYKMLIRNADVPQASMSLRDLGLVDAMMAIQGEELGISADEYHQMLQLQLQTAVLFVPQQLQALAGDFLSKFYEFLEGNRTMKISIAPEYGGNIQQLQEELLGAFYIGNIQRMVELLNLEVETL